MPIHTEKEELTSQSCFIEARNLSKSIANLIRLEISRSQGSPVDDDISAEIDTLTYNELKMKKCILKQVKSD